MKKLISLVLAAGIALVGVSTVQAISESEIQQDIEAFQGYFLKRFPGLTIEDFQDGVNALRNTRIAVPTGSWQWNFRPMSPRWKRR